MVEVGGRDSGRREWVAGMGEGNLRDVEYIEQIWKLCKLRRDSLFFMIGRIFL